MRVMLHELGRTGKWAPGQQVSLDDSEAHHLRVRRAKDGDRVELLDGAGLRGKGHLLQSGKQWAVAIEAIEREERPLELTLAVASGDRDRFSWMLEKAAELGVTAVVPLETARTAAVATGTRDAHLQRLRRRALEATKQCGAAWTVQVEDPVSLPTFLTRRFLGHRWLADQAGAPVTTELDLTPVTVVVGPEGGLTAEERASLESAGYQPSALSPLTLRFETAALAAAAAATFARMRRSHG
jgi:16S rRNA (uracil1498-N3)-methyltransferase